MNGGQRNGTNAQIWGKVKRLELWWQLYRTSLPVWDLENFRQMDFCWHECTMKKVTLTIAWGQFDPTVKNSTTLHVWVSDYVTYSIIICRSNFYSRHWLHNHLLCSSHTKLLHSLEMNLVFLSFDLGKMSHLKTPERRCTTIPVDLPLCYVPHVTEPDKRKKLPILHGRYYGSVSQTFFKWGPLSLVRMFYGPPYSWDYQTN